MMEFIAWIRGHRIDETDERLPALVRRWMAKEGDAGHCVRRGFDAACGASLDEAVRMYELTAVLQLRVRAPIVGRERRRRHDIEWHCVEQLADAAQMLLA